MSRVLLDCLGDPCPVPLVRAQQALENLVIGDVLLVSTDHSCAMKNIPEWAREEGHTVEVEEILSGRWTIQIQKEGALAGERSVDHW